MLYFDLLNSIYIFLVEFTQKTSWHRVCVFKPGLMDAVYTYCKKG